MPLPSKWTYQGDLPSPVGPTAQVNQYFCSTVKLLNGKVLAVQSISYVGAVSPPETLCALYDPTTGLWTATGTTSIAHMTPSLVRLADGKVLLSGGHNGAWPSGVSQATCEVYNPATELWTPTAGNMSRARYDHALVLLQSGLVLAIAGWDGAGGWKSCELFDPAAGTWANTGNLNNTRYNTAGAAVRLANGEVLIAGGYQGAVAGATAERYNPGTGLWTNTGSMAYRRILHQLSLLSDGRAVVSMGYGQLAAGGSYSWISRCETYNPNTGIWTLGTGNFSQGRRSHGSIRLASDNVMVIGGSNSFGSKTQFMSMFDPHADAASNPHGPHASAATLLQVARTPAQAAELLDSGALLVVNGEVTATFPKRTELYTPAGNPTAYGASPAPGATGIAADTDISVSATSIDGGVANYPARITVDGILAWQNNVPQAGYAGSRVNVLDADGNIWGHSWTINPNVDLTAGLHTIQLYVRDWMGKETTYTWSFTVGPAVVLTPSRAPSAGLYTDDIRPEVTASAVLVINSVPEDGETGVPITDRIRLHVVAPGATGLKNNVKVYVTQASDGIKRLAYNQAGGGFQAPFNGSKSVATYQKSPGSAVDDELWLTIHYTANWVSLDLVTVEVQAEAN